MKKLLAGLLFALAGIGTAHAEFTVKQYQALGTLPQAIKLYIAGLGEGHSWANAQLRNTKQNEIYCTPKLLSLSADNYVNILNEELKRDEHQPDYPIAFVLQLGLMRTFPCPWHKYQ